MFGSTLDCNHSHLKLVKQGAMWTLLKENTQRKCVASGVVHPEPASASKCHNHPYLASGIAEGFPHMGRSCTYQLTLLFLIWVDHRRNPHRHRNADHVVTPLCYLCRTLWQKCADLWPMQTHTAFHRYSRNSNVDSKRVYLMYDVSASV